MRQKQLPIIGAILALFFGSNAAVQRGHGNQDRPAPSKIELTHKGTARPIPAPSAKGSATLITSGVTQGKDGCDDSGPASESSKSHSSHSGQSSRRCPLSPVWREICKLNPDFRGDDDLPAPALAKKEFVARCLGNPRPILHLVMASVANPRRTHLGLLTDRAIEAVQVAAAEASFSPHSHSLPWPSPGDSDSDAQAARETDNPPNRSYPGVLIFRKTADPPALPSEYLLVFLVPELPTEGLDREAFLKAESIMEEVSPGTSDIYLAGPNFSGSVASLFALNQELPGKCIHAYGGSITNSPPYDKGCPTLQLAQVSDCEALAAFVKGAKSFGYEKEQIAILSEEGTEYGNLQCKGIPRLWFLHFPREISKLRNAYGAETSHPAQTESTAPQTGLELKWQDSEVTQGDDVRTYGGRQTPLSQETVLSTLSITLRANGIKALAILATDPLDTAFLVHSISESAPDVRLVLRDPDLLYLRTPDVGSLNGTLLVSDYPLIPQNQFWSTSTTDEKANRLITFPSANQEAQYNAFLQLLADAHLVKQIRFLERGWPRGRRAEASANQAAEGTPPVPVWLSTIGTAGHYPVKILNYNKIKDIRKFMRSLQLHSLELGPPQYLPIVLWALVAMLGILHILGLKFKGAVPSYFRRDFDLADTNDAVTLVKISCHMMAVMTIGLAQLVMGSSYLFFYDSSWRYTPLACMVAGVTAILLGAVWHLVHMLYVRQKQQRQLAVPDLDIRAMGVTHLLQSVLIGLSILVGAGTFWLGVTMRPRTDNAFLHFRDLNFTSGVAPALPIASVLLVMYFGVWAYLRRLSYWEHRYVEMCNLKLDPVVRQDMAADVTAIDRCMLGSLENRNWMVGFGLTLCACILAFRPWVTLDMIEPYRVWLFVLLFFVLALFTLWLNWFRFVNIWVHLRNILEHLENLPMRAAFQRMPREKSLSILQSRPYHSTFLLRQVLDKLRALAYADASAENVRLKAEFESKIDALMNQGVVEMEVVTYAKVAGGAPRPVLRPVIRRQKDLLRDACEEMTKVIDVLSARLLKEYWRRGCLAPKEDKDSQAADNKFILAEDIVALPFYAYIRKVMSELRNILFFLGVAISLLFIALHTYAYRADQAIDWWFFGLFALLGGSIVAIIAQMERNALLSRLSDKTSGELGAGFYLQVLKYGAIPFLTIFGSQVPSFSNLVLKWVQPALEALH